MEFMISSGFEALRARRHCRRQRRAVAHRLDIEIAQPGCLDDGQRLAALGDLEPCGDRQRLEGDQGADDRRLRDAQQAGRRLRAREIEHHHRRPVDLARRQAGCGRAGFFARRVVARRVGAPAERFDELPVAGDRTGALALAGHHHGVGHGSGGRRVEITAGAAYHFVQALALAHRRQLLDLAREQAGRRAAVGRGRRERTDQHLELQVAQGAAARRGRQRRYQLLGGGKRRAVPGVGRHAAGLYRQKAGRLVVEIHGLGKKRRRHGEAQHARGEEASAQSDHWGPVPRNGAAAAAAR
jgi:hypothetical protein